MALFGLGRVKASDVFERGVPATGRIVGIAVDQKSENDSPVRYDDYAIEVRTAVPFVAGVRQQLRPDDRVRLGMDVAVRTLDGQVVIDWAATCGGTSAKTVLLKEPPALGIVDLMLGLDKAEKKGVPASVTIVAAEVRAALLGLTRELALDVTVLAQGMEPYDTEITRVKVPHYATHLCGAGRVLPAWVRLDKLDRPVIDWPAAALADPGIGQPAEAVLADRGNVFTGQPASAATAMAAADLRPPVADVAPGHTPVHGVDFDLWVRVEAGLVVDRVAPKDYDTYAQGQGVPAGAWADAAAAWHGRVKADWRLGAAFGEAYEYTRKDLKKGKR